MAGRIVGEAYVLIHAVGRRLHKDVSRAGKKAGDDFSKAFDKELENATKRQLADFRRRLASATESMDFSRFREEGEKASDTIERMNRELRDLVDGGELTEKQFRKIARAQRKWADDDKIAIRVANDTRAFRKMSDVMRGDLQKAIKTTDWERFARREETAAQAARRLSKELGDLGHQAGLSRNSLASARKSLQEWARSEDGAEHNTRKLEYAISRLSKSVGGDLNRAMQSGDWSRFIRRGERASDMVDRLSERIHNSSDEFGLTSQQVARASASLRRWSDSSDAARVRARELDIDMRNLSKHIGTGPNGLSTALENTDWRRFIREGEMSSDMVRRLTQNLEDSRGKFHNMDETIDRSIDSLRRWGEQVDVDGHQIRSFEHDVRRANQRMAASFRQDLARAVSEVDFDHLRHSGEAYDETASRLRHTIHNLSGDMHLNADETERVHHALNDWLQEVDGGSGRLHTFGRRIERVSRRSDRMAHSIGQVFGSGSRNNFLHLLGRAVTGVVRLGVSLPLKAMGAFFRIGGKVAGVLGDTATAFASGAFKEGFKILGGGFKDLALGGAKLIPKLLAVGAAIVALSTAFTTIVAIIGMAASALAGFIGTVAIGLTGWLLPLVPLLAAAAGGFGLLAFSIYKVVKSSKDFPKLKGMVDKLKGTMSDLVDRVAPRVAKIAGFVLSGLTKPLTDATGAVTTLDRKMGLVSEHGRSVFQRFGDAITSVLDDFYDKLRDPRMQGFFKQWGIKLPQIFESLGKGINSLLLGFVGFFTPILPYAQKLADAFKDMADRFLDWTQSAEGQNSISDYMQDAWRIGKKLWNILTDVAGTIGDIFSSGSKHGGEDFLDWLDKAVNKFRDFINAPAGDGSGRSNLDKWFDETKKFFKEVGKTIGKFSDKLKDVDWDKAAKSATDLAESFGGLAKSMGQIVKTGDQIKNSWIFKGIGKGLGFVTQTLQDFVSGNWGQLLLDVILGPFSGFSDKLYQWVVEPWKNIDWSSVGSDIKGKIEDIASGIADGAKRWFNKLPTFVRNALSKVWDVITKPFRDAYDTLLGHSIIPDIVNGIIDWITGLPGKIGTALANAGSMLVKPFKSAWNGLKGWWNETLLPGIKRLFNSILGIFGLGGGGKGDKGGKGGGFTNLLTKPFKSAWNGLKTWWNETLIPGIKDLFNSILGIFGLGGGGKGGKGKGKGGGSLRTVFTHPFQAAWKALKGWWNGTLLPGLRGLFIGIPKKVGSWLASLPGKMGSKFQSAWSKAKSLTSKAWGWLKNKISGIPGNVTSWLSALPGRLRQKWDSAWAKAKSLTSKAWGWLKNKVAAIPGDVGSWLSSLPGKLSSKFSRAWSRAKSLTTEGFRTVRNKISDLPGAAARALSNLASSIAGKFRNAWNSAREWAENIVDSARSKIASLPGKVGSALSGIASAVASPFRSAWNKAKYWWNRIAGLASSIKGKINSIIHAGGGWNPLNYFATGGLVLQATPAMVGEDGPEAVVPLARPLSQVDPSVRWLSAIAQGKAAPSSAPSAPAAAAGRSVVVEPGAIVVKSTANPTLVASKVLDRIVTNIV